MFKDNFEIRNDGILTTDYHSLAGSTIFSVQEIKHGSDDMPDLGSAEDQDKKDIEVQESAKKADLFTKEFVENASKEILIKEALTHWIDVVKAKNKYIQARRAELLGEPKQIEVAGKIYSTEVLRIDGVLAVVSTEGFPWGGRIEFKALEGETKEQLIDRFNAAE